LQNFNLSLMGRNDVGAYNFATQFKDACTPPETLPPPTPVPTSPNPADQKATLPPDLQDRYKPPIPIDTTPIFQPSEPSTPNIWVGIGVPVGGLSVCLLCWIGWLRRAERREAEYQALLVNSRGRHRCRYHQDLSKWARDSQQQSKFTASDVEVMFEEDNYVSLPFKPGTAVPMTVLGADCPPTCGKHECTDHQTDESMTLSVESGIPLLRLAGATPDDSVQEIKLLRHSAYFANTTQGDQSRGSRFSDAVGQGFFQDESVVDSLPIFTEQ